MISKDYRYLFIGGFEHFIGGFRYFIGGFGVFIDRFIDGHIQFIGGCLGGYQRRIFKGQERGLSDDEISAALKESMLRAGEEYLR